MDKKIKYKLIISYDGTNYNGWQAQDDVPTVTTTLQKKFKKIFNTNVILVGASRTDGGVHAIGQVAIARTNLEIDPRRLLYAWNNLLPEDIVIKSLEVATPEFHPMKKVKQKIYFYDFCLQRPTPFNYRYSWFYHWPVNIEKLQACLEVFVGKYDFRSFSTGQEMKSTIRKIDEISLEYIPEEEIYRIIIKGKSFLRYMIRRIVGACIEVASRKDLQVNDLVKALEQKTPEQLLPNAPARGLLLYKIIYDEEESNDDRK